MSSRFGVCVLAAVATLSGQTPPAAVTLRFHHLHYRVLDPGAALGNAADAFAGTRTILQGLGVGVRVGREYVLVDRADAAGRSRRGRKPADAYAEAARWLAQKGLRAVPASLAETAVARPLPDAALDHVAFAVDDVAAAVVALGEKTVSASADAARYRLRSGLIVEIVRDTDRPDAWWCPMHPDVRSPGRGTCARCAMALVPIPPPRLGEYKLDVTLVPRAEGGASGLEIAVRDPETGAPVSTFIDVHERELHLFIVSRDLDGFAHVHPVRRPDGVFELRHDLAVGEYVLIADFLPAGGTLQLVQRAVVTPGFRGALFAPVPDLSSSAREQVAGGLRIRLESEGLRPRRESLLRFTVTTADTGRPVTDLEPYLGAAGHMLVVSSDLTAAIHGHPEGAATSGPLVTFGLVFPAPGRYKLWVQFQHHGQVVTAAFVVTVPSR